MELFSQRQISMESRMEDHVTPAGKILSVTSEFCIQLV